MNFKDKEFASFSIHEIKTSLQIIRGYLDLYFLEPNEKNKKVLQNEVDIINNLSEKCLRFYQIKTAKNYLNLKKIDLISVLQEQFFSFAEKYPSHKFSAKNLKQNKIILIDADIFAFKELIKIFLENAINYSPKNQKIEIDLEITKKQKIISIRNEGVGIKKSDQKEIFKPYFQVKKNKKYTGLSLAIAKEIARLHKFDLKLESDEKNYTKFLIII